MYLNYACIECGKPALRNYCQACIDEERQAERDQRQLERDE